MKKEVMDILQNELVFDRLSGSAGNITAVSMGNKHYFRKKVLNTKLMSKNNTISERFE